MEKKFNADLRSKEVLALCNKIYHGDKDESEKSNDYIRWFIVDETNKCFHGGVPIYTEYDIRLDIYSTKNFRPISETVIKTLENKGYTVIENENDVFLDTVRLSQLIKKIISNPTLKEYLSQQSRLIFKNKYNIEEMKRKYSNLFIAQ